MSFGPYTDFADCVSKNGDKGNPEAFCAWLEHNITGKWPTEASQYPPERLAILESVIADSFKSFHFQALETKTISGVEVFSVGTWADSLGQVNEWTEENVKTMARSFKSGVIPLKVGHTSPEFNLKVAESLGIPVQLLTGDNAGKGQIALGMMTQLKFQNGKLIADFEGVPAPLADLIEGGQYASVSAEIEFSNQDSPVLMGVALLGVEKPAIPILAGLEAVKIFGEREKTRIFSFTRKEGDLNKITKDTTIKEMLALFQEGSADALTAIAVALGLDPQTATLANVLKAIQDLKAGGPGMMPEAVAEQKAAFAKAQGDLATLTKTVEAQQATIATFEHERRVVKFTKVAEGWRGIPGKPEDIGAQLAETEEKAGEKVAQMVVAQFQAANKAAETAGLLKPLGTARQSEGISEAGKKMLQFQASGLSEEKAYQKLAKEAPGLFRQLQASQITAGGNHDGE